MFTFCLYSPYFQKYLVKMKYCWAPNCKETNNKKTEVSFHLFPKVFHQRELWIKATGRLDKPGKTAVLCSKHFKQTDFDCTTKRIRLKTDVIPSQFENVTEVKIKLEERPHDSAASAASSSAPLLPEPIHVEDSINKFQPDNVHNTQSFLSKPITVVSQSPQKTLWQPRHLLQVRPEHLSSPSKRDRYWSQAIQEIMLLRKKVKVLQGQKRRMVKRIKMFKSMMAHLGEKRLMDNND